MSEPEHVHDPCPEIATRLWRADDNLKDMIEMIGPLAVEHRRPVEAFNQIAKCL